MSVPKPRAAAPLLSISIDEARPSSLVLRLASTAQVRYERVEVWRQTAAAQPEVIQTISVDPKTWETIKQKGILFLDHNVPASPLQYRLAGVLGDERTFSAPLVVMLSPAPPAPSALTAIPMANQVELNWSSSPELGAIVFRRDLLAGEKRPQRIAIVEPSARQMFVDHRIRPGGAYAYQIALARSYSKFMQFGPPSEEIYVNVPEVEP